MNEERIVFREHRKNESGDFPSDYLLLYRQCLLEFEMQKSHFQTSKTYFSPQCGQPSHVTVENEVVKFNVYLQSQGAKVLEKVAQQNEGSILDVSFHIFEERMEGRKGEKELSRQVEEEERVYQSQFMTGSDSGVYKKEENKEDQESPGR